VVTTPCSPSLLRDDLDVVFGLRFILTRFGSCWSSTRTTLMLTGIVFSGRSRVPQNRRPVGDQHEVSPWRAARSRIPDKPMAGRGARWTSPSSGPLLITRLRALLPRTERTCLVAAKACEYW